MTSRPSTAAPILAVLAILAALLGAYVGGYLWLSETDSQLFIDDDGSKHQGQVRFFQHDALVRLFYPASVVERWVTGRRTGNSTPYREG